MTRFDRRNVSTSRAATISAMISRAPRRLHRARKIARVRYEAARFSCFGLKNSKLIISLIMKRFGVSFRCGSDEEAPVTPEQVRAARQLLGWSRFRLAARIGVSHPTAIARYEDGKGQSRYLDLHAVRAVLEAAGVEFVEDNGEGPMVRLRKGSE
jgi:hypothetical protein